MTETAPSITNDSSDEALVVAVRAGDRQAFSVLVTRHGLRFRSIACRVLNDTTLAEEVVQDAFIKLWTNAGAFDPGKAKFTTWFHRVVVNRALDVKRRKQPETMPEGFDTADPGQLADAGLEQTAETAKVMKALSSLSERQKTALTLSYLDGYSNNEAADIMALNIKAFESLLVRARAKMRDMLKADKENLLSVFG